MDSMVSRHSGSCNSVEDEPWSVVKSLPAFKADVQTVIYTSEAVLSKGGAVTGTMVPALPHFSLLPPLTILVFAEQTSNLRE